MTRPKYSIVIAHLNMADTVEASVRSIVEQVNKHFEVIIIDDGSSDGSLNSITRLCSEYDNLSYYVESNSNMAEAINSGVQKSEGEYILTHADADNIYKDAIIDFAMFGEKIQEAAKKNKHIVGQGIDIGPKSLYEKYPYRPLGYGEDKDRWRRLLGDNRLVWFDHVPICQQIGYERSLIEKAQTEYETAIVNFRSGVTYRSFLRWYLRHPKSLGSWYLIVVSPLAFIQSLRAGRFELPINYMEKSELNKGIDHVRGSFQELKEEFELNISSSDFSELGESLLCNYYGSDEPMR